MYICIRIHINAHISSEHCLYLHVYLNYKSSRICICIQILAHLVSPHGANMAIPQPGGFNIPFAISSHSSTCVTFWNTWPSLAGHRWIVRRVEFPLVNFSRLGGDLIQNPKTGETTKSLDLEWKSFEGILSLSSMNTRRRIKCKNAFQWDLCNFSQLEHLGGWWVGGVQFQIFEW